MTKKRKSPPIKLRRITLNYNDGRRRIVDCWRFWDSRDDKRLGMQLDPSQDPPHHWLFVPEDHLESWSVDDTVDFGPEVVNARPGPD